jgi:hypothetical protein
VIEAQGVTFFQTPLENGEYDMTSPNGDLTAHGSFYGVSIPRERNILYFSKEYFLNSAKASASSIKILPYRAYYTTSAPSNVSRFNVLFLDIADGTDSGESVVSEDGGFVDAIDTLQNESTKTVWYNLNGQQLNSRPTLPGVYVVNGKKVLIKK